MSLRNSAIQDNEYMNSGIEDLQDLSHVWGVPFEKDNPLIPKSLRGRKVYLISFELVFGYMKTFINYLNVPKLPKAVNGKSLTSCQNQPMILVREKVFAKTKEPCSVRECSRTGWIRSK